MDRVSAFAKELPKKLSLDRVSVEEERTLIWEKKFRFADLGEIFRCQKKKEYFTDRPSLCSVFAKDKSRNKRESGE